MPTTWGSKSGAEDGKGDRLDDWITYPYHENGQDFTVVQRKDRATKDDLREDGPFESMNRDGRYIVPINRFRDVVLVPSITADMFVQQREEIRLRDGDIVVATFPRSGTTWTEQLVMLLLSKGDPSQLNTRDKNAYDPSQPTRPGKVFLDYLYHAEPTRNIAAPWGKTSGNDITMRAADIDAMPFTRRVFKTHHLAHMLIGFGPHADHLDRCEPPPLPKNVKFLWVSRDPKDVMLSMMHINTTNYEAHDFPITAFAKLFLDGVTNRGSWALHTTEWSRLAEQRPDVILPLTYEGNKADPLGAARRIASFLDIDVTEDELQNCVKWSSFDAMKEMSKGGTYVHVHSGRVGGWQQQLSPDVIQGFNEMLSDPALGEHGRRYTHHFDKQQPS